MATKKDKSGIVKMTARTIILTSIVGEEKKFKAPKTWCNFCDVLLELTKPEDQKAVCDFYRKNLSDDDYARFRNQMFPTLADKKQQKARSKAIRQWLNDGEVEVLEKQMWADPGFNPIPGKVTRREVDGVADKALQAYYGVA
jgi:hypothetical protein